MSAVNSGPNIIKNGLVLNLDASARRSYLPNSLINMNNWTVSTGGVTGYIQNGNTAENQRTSTTNPWGDTDVIWGSYPSGDGNADGGWVTDNVSIDKTKLYRFSVWMKRTSSTTGGTAYLGGTAWDAAQYLKRTVDSVDEPNPYWYYSNIASFTQDVWYLLVGHLYPYNTTFTGRHPDSGLYNPNNSTKVADIGGNTGGGDFKFASTSTYLHQRVFHYYCGDSTSRLQFYDPRVDLVDGKQPSITELVKYSPARWRDLIANYNGTLTNKPTYSTSNGGNFLFDGTNDNVQLGTASTFLPTSAITINTWVKTNVTGVYKKIFVTVTSGTASVTGIYFSLGPSSDNVYLGIITNNGTQYATSNATIPTTSYINLCGTYDGSNIKIYLNGSLIATQAQTGTIVNSGIGRISGYDNGGEIWDGNIASFSIYNRALTAQEISQNYQQTKTRFGL